MPKRWVLPLQLLLGWLPIWALFSTLMLTAHPGTDAHRALLISLRMMLTAALLGLLVYRLTERVPWPPVIRLPFLGLHLVAAMAYAGAWILLNSLVESVWRGEAMLVVGYGLGPFLILGVWLYVMIAGVAYASNASDRAARAEVAAARSQLATLRAQLHPHFLFNALHTVVQLMPREPERAARAAEQLAGLLRTAIEEDRDLVSLAEEWSFVQRYLELEALRFGDRLEVTAHLPDETHDAVIPSFSLQALVENAVRHGASPRVAPTTITVTARADEKSVRVSVHDNGGGADLGAVARSEGTGLRRLRERLAVLYGAAARLELASSASGGFGAELVIPRRAPDE